VFRPAYDGNLGVVDMPAPIIFVSST
jgi:hypothetical protein